MRLVVFAENESEKANAVEVPGSVLGPADTPHHKEDPFDTTTRSACGAPSCNGAVARGAVASVLTDESTLATPATFSTVLSRGTPGGLL